MKIVGEWLLAVTVSMWMCVVTDVYPMMGGRKVAANGALIQGTRRELAATESEMAKLQQKLQRLSSWLAENVARVHISTEVGLGGYIQNIQIFVDSKPSYNFMGDVDSDIDLPVADTRITVMDKYGDSLDYKISGQDVKGLSKIKLTLKGPLLLEYADVARNKSIRVDYDQMKFRHSQGVQR